MGRKLALSLLETFLCSLFTRSLVLLESLQKTRVFDGVRSRLHLGEAKYPDALLGMTSSPVVLAVADEHLVYLNHFPDASQLEASLPVFFLRAGAQSFPENRDVPLHGSVISAGQGLDRLDGDSQAETKRHEDEQGDIPHLLPVEGRPDSAAELQLPAWTVETGYPTPVFVQESPFFVTIWTGLVQETFLDEEVHDLLSAPEGVVTQTKT